MKEQLTAKRVMAWAALAVLCVPSIVFMVAAFTGGMSVSDAFAAFSEQAIAQRTNLIVVSAMGLIPIALLALVVWITSKITRFADKRVPFAVGGSLAIVLVVIWTNCEYWFSYLPGRQFLGFPHGLEFVIGPLIFAPIAMLVGIVVAALVPAVKQ